MQQVDEAFVLRTQPLGEADLVVSLLARTHGRVRGVARAARRSRKRFGGLLEPMTHVQATWTTKAGRDLHRIEGLESRHSYAAMQSDPVLQTVCAVMAEVSEAFGQEGDADDREFRLIAGVLDALQEGGEPLQLLRYFEFWMLRLHGLLGDPGECAGCGRAIEPGRARFVAQDGGFRCRDCRERSELATALTPGEADSIARLLRQAPETLPPAGTLAGQGGSLARLFRMLLENFAERRFRSYRHLQTFVEWTENDA